MLSAKNHQPPRPLRVFLCYSPADKSDVHKLYKRLKAEGIEVWFNEENLLGGQDWKQAIQKAVQTTDVVIVCLSKSSINTVGYVNKEIKFALDAADEQPEGSIFLIPFKLEECSIPDQLSRWHGVNYFEEKGYENLKRALQERAKTLGVTFIPTSTPALQRVSTTYEGHNGRSGHIICLIVIPFNINSPASFAYETVLLPALRTVLEQHPYYWQVAYSNDKVHDDAIDRNIEEWMKHAQTYIVDVSDRDTDVMIKLGNLTVQTKRRGQLLLILERDGIPQLPGRSGITRISYPDLHGLHAIDDIAQGLMPAFAGKPKIRELLSTEHDHYLSSLLLTSNEFSMNTHRAITLSSEYITMEALVAASIEDICRTIQGLSPHVARGYQEAIRELLARL